MVLNKQNPELIASGHTACAGCGEITSLKMLMRAVGKKCVVCEATSCMEITTSSYPTTAWRVPWIHVLFENAAAVASGVARALKKQGKEDVTVIAMGGDGGMADIGLQAMSGAMERDENILIVCHDNESYANTGVQRSSLTPLFASTTTSPAGKKIPGKIGWKKNIAEICAAHGIPYVATVNLAYPGDFENKIKKALTFKGPKFIHMFCPCPVGWKFDSSKSIEIAKLAVETGMWALYEIENGKLKMTYKPKELKPVEEYLKPQGRFSHVKGDLLKKLQEVVKQEYNKLLEREKC